MRFAFGCVIVSTLSALCFLLGGHVPSARGPSGGVGIMVALIGSGVACLLQRMCRSRLGYNPEPSAAHS
jgi:hypothetical protein